jgi:hypothetical protein
MCSIAKLFLSRSIEMFETVHACASFWHIHTESDLDIQMKHKTAVWLANPRNCVYNLFLLILMPIVTRWVLI